MKKKVLSALCLVLTIVLVLPLTLNFKAAAIENSITDVAENEDIEFERSLMERRAVGLKRKIMGNQSSVQSSPVVNYENKICRIKNIASSKYMKVYNEKDANDTNVCQNAVDNTMGQDFYIMVSGTTCRIFAMCSSYGFNRQVGYNRGTKNVVCSYGGTSVYTYTWNIIPTDVSGQFYIVSSVDSNAYLTAYGTENGTYTGTLTTSPGNIFVSAFTGENNQKWHLGVYANQYTIDYFSTPASTESDTFHVNYVVASKKSGAEYNLIGCPTTYFELPFIPGNKCGVNVYATGYERKTFGIASSSVTRQTTVIKKATDYGFNSSYFRNPISGTINEKGTSTYPMVSSHYGMRPTYTSSGYDLEKHAGIDITVLANTGVFAMHNGRIYSNDPVGVTSRGKYIELQISASNGKTYYITYEHLDTVLHEVGDEVLDVMVIGYIGALDVIPHLHVSISTKPHSSGLSEEYAIDPSMLMTIN